MSEQVDLDTVMQELQQLRDENNAIKAKNQELLGDIKKNKSARETAEMEKAKQSGEYEQLWKTEEKRAKELEEALNNERKGYREERIHSHALKMAAEIAASATSAKLLSHFVKESISNLADERGNISDEEMAAVMKKIKSNNEFAPLVAGSKASGGGASGSSASGAGNVVNEINMADYRKLDPYKKLEVSRLVQAGKLTIID